MRLIMIDITQQQINNRIQMSNSNPVSVQNIQSQAYTHFLQREYPKCLQLYTQVLKQPSLPHLSRLMIQTTIAIIHIHLHNYSEAHQRLSVIVNKIQQFKKYMEANFETDRKGTVSYYKQNAQVKANQSSGITQQKEKKGNKDQFIQVLLLSIKVQACFILIQLANCNRQYVFQHLDQLLQHIESATKLEDSRLLLRSAMLMLIGVESIQSLSNKSQVALQSGQTEPLLMTCLSMHTQLLSWPELSYELQHRAHEQLKQYRSGAFPTVPILISCKHLIHLCDVLGYYTAKQSYQSEFNKLMNMPEIYGISQQTLFRGYEEKIKLGREIIGVLADYQKKVSGDTLIENDDPYLRWIHKRVVYKLQQALYLIQTNSRSTAGGLKTGLIRTLNTLNSSQLCPQIMSYMLNSPLILSILKQEQENLNKIFEKLSNYAVSFAWRTLMMLPPKIDEHNTQLNKGEYSHNGKAQEGKIHISYAYHQKEHRYKKQSKWQNSNTEMKINGRKEDDSNLYSGKSRVQDKQRMQLQRLAQKKKQEEIQERERKIEQEERIRQRQRQQQIAQRERQMLMERQQKQRQIQLQKRLIQEKSKSMDIQRQKLKQLENQLEKQRKRQDQARRLDQGYKSKQQSQRYQQFRSKHQQSRYTVNQSQMPYVDRQFDAGYKLQRQKPALEQREKNWTKEDRGSSQEYYYLSNQQGQLSQRKINNKKIEHVNTIQKSPIKNGSYLNQKADVSPRQNYNKQGINSRIKIQRTERNYESRQQQRNIEKSAEKHKRYFQDEQEGLNQKQRQRERSKNQNYRGRNVDLNSSKIANHMNNVYLDSDSSRFVNPLQQFSSENAQNPVGHLSISPKVKPHRGVNNKFQKRQADRSTHLNQNKIQKGGKQISKVPIMPSISISKIENKVIADDENQQMRQGDVISILKSQNSRIKNAVKEVQGGDLAKSRVEITQIYQQKKQVISKDGPQTLPNTNISSVNNNSRLQYQTARPNQNLNANPNLNSNFNVNTSANSNQNKNVNINGNNNQNQASNNQGRYIYPYHPNNPNNPNRTNNFNSVPNQSPISLSPNDTIPSRHVVSPSPIQPNLLDKSQQQVQFNNVDVFIQPAVNPNNVSNFTSVIGSRINTTNNNAGLGLLPKEISTKPFLQPGPQIPNRPQPQPQPQTNGQQSNLIKKTVSENELKGLQKLTPQSAYIRKLKKLCMEGQYFIKRHYSSDGGQQRFIKLADNFIKYAVDEDKINTSFKTYKLSEIKGITYGKVTDTFLKECNKKLLPWLCFSLIMSNRTVDFYCTDEIDPLIWLPGLTAGLAGQTITLKSPKAKSKLNQRERKSEQIQISLYTPGRVLWKRVLMKLNQKYIKPLKKNQRTFKNANAHSILLWKSQFEKNQKVVRK